MRNTWDQLRKERDFHRMHHRRVVQEKNSLIKQLKRLKKYCDAYEPTIQALKAKYESAMKEKMLMRIDRDKISVKLETMEEQLKSMQESYTTHNPHSSHALSKSDFISSNSNNKTGSKNSRRKKNNFSQSQKENTFLNPNHLINNNNNNNNNRGNTSNSDNNNRDGRNRMNQEKLTPFPSNNYENPYINEEFESIQVETFSMNKTFDAHKMAISRIVLHPTKDIVCTTSDDTTWKLWNLPDGELIMSGEGHKDWLSDCSFHPSGAILVTSSGDATMKLWDFAQSKCIYTWDEFTNQKSRNKKSVFLNANSLHTQAVWSVDFHHTNGNFMISSSMDHTCKLWDLGKQIDINMIKKSKSSYKCRQTYRGHVDSVNYCLFQPYSNNVVTASGDKTISFWDIKSGLCIQTFYGHTNSVNHITFNPKGDVILSSDADGICKLFDIRMIRELKSIDTGKLVNPCNQATFDISGKKIVAASDDGTAKVFDAETGESKGALPGHTEGINSLLFTHDYSMLVTAGADGTVRLWQ